MKDTKNVSAMAPILFCCHCSYFILNVSSALKNGTKNIIVKNMLYFQEVTSFKISSGTNANVAIKSIEFSRRGR